MEFNSVRSYFIFSPLKKRLLRIVVMSFFCESLLDSHEINLRYYP